MTINQAEIPPLVLEAARLILCVWRQYGNDGNVRADPPQELFLRHFNMSAGEDAADFLESLGLAIDDGCFCIPTAAGLKLMGIEGQFKPGVYGTPS